MSGSGRVADKTAIVTGAARGQGAADARLLAAEGANVVVTDLLDAEGEALAAELGERGAFARLDVRDQNQWESAVDLAMQRFGRLDVLVNNAGIGRTGTIAELPLEDYELVIDVNQHGPWRGIRAAVPAMRESGGGSIVNVGSAVAYCGFASEGPYVAAKWALRGITRTAALELAGDNIRVNAVHPGWIDTPMNAASTPMEDGRTLAQTIGEDGIAFGLTCPMRRMASAEEAARVILFLASDDSSYCTGADFVPDGGMLAGPMPAGWDAGPLNADRR